MIITTSICANYLPKAMVLAKSIKEHNPDAKIMICLLEKEIHPIAENFQYFDYVVLSKELGFENFEQFIFKHSIVEAATSVKGQIFRYMLEAYPKEDKFVYLDPDIKVYGELVELNKALDENEIVLTPHLTIPEDILDAVMDNELCALQHGVFNLGFLAIRRGDESERFIDWWASRLEMFCYDDIPRGIFTDQKWIDLAPCFFDVFVFRHPGYNIAPWNLSKRKVIQDKTGNYLVNGQPLRFFHFSGFDSGANEAMINKYVPDKNNVIYNMRDIYVSEMNGMGQDEIGKTPWAYNYYLSGEEIDRLARLVYRDDLALKYTLPHPFTSSNEAILSNIKKAESQAEPDNFEHNTGLYNRVRELEKEIETMKNTLGWRILNRVRRRYPKVLNLLKKIVMYSK